jgi:hypothetical protein
VKQINPDQIVVKTIPQTQPLQQQQHHQQQPYHPQHAESSHTKQENMTDANAQNQCCIIA